MSNTDDSLLDQQEYFAGEIYERDQTIATQAERIAELEGKIESGQKVALQNLDLATWQRQRAEAAEADNARLRETVKRYRFSSDREWLGKLVRHAWVDWAKEQENPKPSWLVPWEDLKESDREADRRIGEFLASQCVSPELLRVEADNAKLRDACEAFVAWWETLDKLPWNDCLGPCERVERTIKAALTETQHRLPPEHPSGEAGIEE